MQNVRTKQDDRCRTIYVECEFHTAVASVCEYNNNIFNRWRVHLLFLLICKLLLFTVLAVCSEVACRCHNLTANRSRLTMSNVNEQRSIKFDRILMFGWKTTRIVLNLKGI